MLYGKVRTIALLVRTKKNSGRDVLGSLKLKQGASVKRPLCFCALSVGEESSVLEELISAKSCAYLVALVSFNL